MGNETKPPESLRVQPAATEVGIIAAPDQPKRRDGRPVVVKIQLPIAGDMGQALVYDEKRTIQMQVPVGSVAKRVPRGVVKAYFKAEIVDDILEIGERILLELGW